MKAHFVLYSRISELTANILVYRNNHPYASVGQKWLCINVEGKCLSPKVRTLKWHVLCQSYILNRPPVKREGNVHVPSPWPRTLSIRGCSGDILHPLPPNSTCKGDFLCWYPRNIINSWKWIRSFQWKLKKHLRTVLARFLIAIMVFNRWHHSMLKQLYLVTVCLFFLIARYAWSWVIITAMHYPHTYSHFFFSIFHGNGVR